MSENLGLEEERMEGVEGGKKKGLGQETEGRKGEYGQKPAKETTAAVLGQGDCRENASNSV